MLFFFMEQRCFETLDPVWVLESEPHPVICLSPYCTKHPLEVTALFKPCEFRQEVIAYLYVNHKPLYTSLLESMKLTTTLYSYQARSTTLLLFMHISCYSHFTHVPPRFLLWLAVAWPHTLCTKFFFPKPTQNTLGLLHELGAVLISSHVVYIKAQLSSPDYYSGFNSSVYGSQQLHATRMSNWGTACVYCCLSPVLMWCSDSVRLSHTESEPRDAGTDQKSSGIIRLHTIKQIIDRVRTAKSAHARKCPGKRQIYKHLFTDLLW